MPGPSVSFENVGVQLGGQAVLDDVSFFVPAGSIHCIVGPNGGGKTTLIRALLGQIAFSGKIVLEGEREAVIGYAPQSLDLDRTLPFTVTDVLAVMNQRKPVFLGRSKALRAEQDRILETVGLQGKAGRLFGYLSGGERQRLLFAQALLPMPDLLIMDEPTSNMDDEGARLVEGIVKDVAAKGVTVIWINHDWEQVCRVADAATMINHKVVADGPPRQVLSLGMAPEQVR